MNKTDNIPRWRYRYDNYQKAFTLLEEAIQTAQKRPLSSLEQEGMIQRFEYTWELAWKLLKDYLQFEGIELERTTPNIVIRTAFESKLIKDGELWMQALRARNEMAHEYDTSKFEKITEEIQEIYFQLLKKLHTNFQQKSRS